MKKTIHIKILMLLIIVSVLSALAADINKNKEIDKSNLCILYTSIAMYAQDFKGFCPPDLGVLCDLGYVEGLIYVSPNSQTKVPNNGEDIRKGACDYLYFGKGVNLESLTKEKKVIPLMSTKAELYPGTYIVLYSNRLVEESSSLPNKKEIKDEKGQGSVDVQQPRSATH